MNTQIICFLSTNAKGITQEAGNDYYHIRQTLKTLTDEMISSDHLAADNSDRVPIDQTWGKECVGVVCEGYQV